MHAAACAAREHGRFGDAAQLWRQALRERPAHWQAALELRRDLSAAGHYAESDPVFRQALPHFPDAEWLAYFDSIYALHHDHLDVQQARAHQVVLRHPDDSRAHRLLGEIAWQRRDLASAEEGFAGCARLRSDDAAVRSKLELVRLYRRLSMPRRVAEPLVDASGDAYAIQLINLDRNTERLAEIRRQFQDCPVKLRRVRAVNGGALPDDAVRALAGDAGAPRGTLGCFLSHAAAWQAVVDLGLRHCLVIEDDVMPLLDLPARLGPLGLPEEYDLCFVNDRLQPRRKPDELARMDGFSAMRLADAMMRFPPDENAPGADAYLVSGTGAAKLLEWVAQDGYAGDVDWRLLAYSLTPDQVADLPQGHAKVTLAAMQHQPPRTDRLKATVLCPALIRTVPFSSDREDGNRGET